MDFRIFLFAGCISFCLFNCSQTKSDFWDEIEWDKASVYIAYRGTKTKQGFFAKDFNIMDSLSSHVGLLLSHKDGWYVYNVSDFKDGLSDFRKQPIEEFYSLEEEKITSASLWKINLDSIELNKFIAVLRSYNSKTINFDRYFTLTDSSRLYCSQFVRDVLFQTDSTVLI